MNTLYWHDYETFGTDPQYDRPAQFAGIRTDNDLNIIGDPLIIYCQQSDDTLPHPRACLITGLTPQKVKQKGVIEAEFISRIHAELIRPATCTVGYNNIRFDDEFTRFTLYRNFYDSYAREWQQGNSRWDIIDMVRLARALRPDGINWPDNDENKPSFKLQDLAVANNINHENAHDALADVYATIALAKLIKTAQPKLYDFVYRHRYKNKVAPLVNIAKHKPIIHVSRMYASKYCGTALVVPVAKHPTNSNGIIVYDLRHDPSPLINETADTLRQWLFNPDDLPASAAIPALKTLHINRCPVVVPEKTLDDKSATRLAIDRVQYYKHLDKLIAAGDLTQKITAIYTQADFTDVDDVDSMLYSGGFFSDNDKNNMRLIRHADPEALKTLSPHFDDNRLPEMLFRYRARNWPASLTNEEKIKWQHYCQERLTGQHSPALTFSQFFDEIAACQEEKLTGQQQDLLTDLMAHANTLESNG